MPIEIKELVIKTVIDKSNDKTENSTAKSDIDTKQIVDICVKEVLDKLRSQKER